MTLFFGELTETKRMCAYFMQDNVTTYTHNFSITALKKVFIRHLIPHTL